MHFIFLFVKGCSANNVLWWESPTPPLYLLLHPCPGHSDGVPLLFCHLSRMSGPLLFSPPYAPTSLSWFCPAIGCFYDLSLFPLTCLLSLPSRLVSSYAHDKAGGGVVLVHRWSASNLYCRQQLNVLYYLFYISNDREKKEQVGEGRAGSSEGGMALRKPPTWHGE